MYQSAGVNCSAKHTGTRWHRNIQQMSEHFIGRPTWCYWGLMLRKSVLGLLQTQLHLLRQIDRGDLNPGPSCIRFHWVRRDCTGESQSDLQRYLLRRLMAHKTIWWEYLCYNTSISLEIIASFDDNFTAYQMWSGVYHPERAQRNH